MEINIGRNKVSSHFVGRTRELKRKNEDILVISFVHCSKMTVSIKR